MIIKRSESVLAQGSECRLLLGALGEAEQSAKRKAQRCFAPKRSTYNFCEIDDIHIFDVMIYRPPVILSAVEESRSDDIQATVDFYSISN